MYLVGRAMPNCNPCILTNLIIIKLYNFRLYIYAIHFLYIIYMKFIHIRCLSEQTHTQLLNRLTFTKHTNIKQVELDSDNKEPFSNHNLTLIHEFQDTFRSGGYVVQGVYPMKDLLLYCSMQTYPSLLSSYLFCIS